MIFALNLPRHGRLSRGFRRLAAARRTGLTLIEVMVMCAIATILTGNQIPNTGLETEKGYVETTSSGMSSMGTKLSEYCNDNHRVCGATGASQTITVPASYLAPVPKEPQTGNAYTWTIAADASGNQCFTIEGTHGYSHDAILSLAKSDGSREAPSGAAGPEYLHYDSRVGGNYWSATNTSPLAGGAC
jgi:Tfp pilus assembly protein PilE